jgi:hypothetical protein
MRLPGSFALPSAAKHESFPAYALHKRAAGTTASGRLGISEQAATEIEQSIK